MGFLRREAEEVFLNFLPPEVRLPMLDSWYIPAKNRAQRIGEILARIDFDNDFVEVGDSLHCLGRPTQVDFGGQNLGFLDSTDRNIQEEGLRSYRRVFSEKMKNHLGSALGYNDKLNPDESLPAIVNEPIGPISSFDDFDTELAKISDIRASQSQWVRMMPSLAMIVVKDGKKSEIYTALRNKDQLNLGWISGENERRNVSGDSMVFYKGVFGSYPNHFFVINLEQASEFLQDMVAITDHASYEAWITRYGNPRHGPGSERFWQNSDTLHDVFQEKSRLRYGIFDYNRYGTDYRYHEEGDFSLEDFLSSEQSH